MARLRKEAGHTQQQRADYAGISRVTLSAFENGSASDFGRLMLLAPSFSGRVQFDSTESSDVEPFTLETLRLEGASFLRHGIDAHPFGAGRE